MKLLRAITSAIAATRKKSSALESKIARSCCHVNKVLNMGQLKIGCVRASKVYSWGGRGRRVRDETLVAEADRFFLANRIISN